MDVDKFTKKGAILYFTCAILLGLWQGGYWVLLTPIYTMLFDIWIDYHFREQKQGARK